jgi:DNA-binding FrmR family transcriptional regulator
MAEALKIVEGRALTAQQKKDLLNRLARVEGQLRGIQKLVALADAPSDCEAVAQQMAAARKALDRSFVQLLTASIVTHTGNADDLDQAKESAARLAALFDKFA